jgi:hypothetical protein
VETKASEEPLKPRVGRWSQFGSVSSTRKGPSSQARFLAGAESGNSNAARAGVPVESDPQVRRRWDTLQCLRLTPVAFEGARLECEPGQQHQHKPISSGPRPN